MTLPDFLAAFDRAVVSLRPTLLTGPGYYPAGPYLRYLVVRGSAEPDRIPPVVDPIGLVWYAQTQQLRGPLDSVAVGAVLGLPADLVAWIILVSDGKREDAGTLGRFIRLG